MNEATKTNVWKLSFAKPTGFLGVVIVPDLGNGDEKVGFSRAIALSRELDANPGGEILGQLMSGIQGRYLGRLLSRTETDTACKTGTLASKTSRVFYQRDNEEALEKFKSGEYPRLSEPETIARLKNLEQTAA